MTHPLANLHCQSFASGGEKLSATDIQTHLDSLHADWQFNESEQVIERDFKFKNYYETMAFVNALAWLAHQENHHPDMSVHYNHCLVQYSTHDVSGISLNDMICAYLVDQLGA